jgi:hypothetical protein
MQHAGSRRHCVSLVLPDQVVAIVHRPSCMAGRKDVAICHWTRRRHRTDGGEDADAIEW